MINSFLIKIVFLLFGKSIKENLLNKPTNCLHYLSMIIIYGSSSTYTLTSKLRQTEIGMNYTYYKNTKEYKEYLFDTKTDQIHQANEHHRCYHHTKKCRNKIN